MSSISAREEARQAHTLRLRGGERIRIRPIRPQDAGTLQTYIRGLSRESRRNRFLGPINELTEAELDRVTHPDRPGELTLIVESRRDGAGAMIGEIRYAIAPDRRSCEFAISVADAWRGKGLGTMLIGNLECRARSLGVRCLVGDVAYTNAAMRALARKAGFDMAGPPRDARLVRVVKDISGPQAALPCGEQTALSIAA